MPIEPEPKMPEPKRPTLVTLPITAMPAKTTPPMIRRITTGMPMTAELRPPEVTPTEVNAVEPMPRLLLMPRLMLPVINIANPVAGRLARSVKAIIKRVPFLWNNL
jgi:hypothetical protein